ncbi:hypothetical protein HK405_009335 [Cladochytrium tenue]|nr:hypothetical protein HK405_009335 [Cladochytrium tenue]
MADRHAALWWRRRVPAAELELAEAARSRRLRAVAARDARVPLGWAEVRGAAAVMADALGTEPTPAASGQAVDRAQRNDLGPHEEAAEDAEQAEGYDDISESSDAMEYLDVGDASDEEERFYDDDVEVIDDDGGDDGMDVTEA